MKLDRLMGILTILLRGGQVTAPALAKIFEVSRRTITRDIEALCKAGIPVVTRQGGGGGISIAEGYKLDGSVLTADELSGMVAALKGLGSVTEPSRTERLLDKLGGGEVVSLRESIVINLASHYRDSLTEKIELLRRAVHQRHLVAFDYYSSKGKERRHVEPCFITFQWSAWYLFGFCTDREDWRLFKLGRLWELSLCTQTFQPRDVPPEKADFDVRFDDQTRLTALFEPAAEYRLLEEYGPTSYSKQSDGRLLLEIGFTNCDYIVRWLLGFGDVVTVLGPADLAEEICRTAQSIAARYADWSSADRSSAAASGSG